MQKNEFFPFYERIAGKFPIPTLGWLTFPLLVGGAYFLLHLSIVGFIGISYYKVWLLTLIIILALIFVMYATRILRSLFIPIEIRNPTKGKQFAKFISKSLSNKGFVLFGLFFGISNVLIGHLLGVDYPETGDFNPSLAKASLYFGFFLAGFVCGIAVLGILAIIWFLGRYLKSETFHLEFDHPDRCGGTFFIGKALAKFSIITLIIGVLISFYIFNAGFIHPDNIIGEALEPSPFYISFIMWFWVVFPFLMALFVLFFPATALHRILNAYKVRQEQIVEKSLLETKAKMDRTGKTTKKFRDLEKTYEARLVTRKELFEMRVWPFNNNLNFKFLGLFSGNFYLMLYNAIDLPGMPQALNEFIEQIITS